MVRFVAYHSLEESVYYDLWSEMVYLMCQISGLFISKVIYSRMSVIAIYDALY
jgi:hypothetical protein